MPWTVRQGGPRRIPDTHDTIVREQNPSIGRTLVPVVYQTVRIHQIPGECTEGLAWIFSSWGVVIKEQSGPVMKQGLREHTRTN